VKTDEFAVMKESPTIRGDMVGGYWSHVAKTAARFGEEVYMVK